MIGKFNPVFCHFRVARFWIFFARFSTATRAGLSKGICETGLAARSAASTLGSSGIMAIGISLPISTGAVPDLKRLNTI